MKKVLSLLLVVALFMCTLAGCGNNAGNNTDGQGSSSVSSALNTNTKTVSAGKNDIVYGVGSSWVSLMPFDQPTTYSTMVQDDLFEPLAKAGDGKLVYRAAESIKTSKDGRVWTCKLNPKLTWSDGKPCTAEDWVWTYQMETDPSFGVYTSSYTTNLLAGTDDKGFLIKGKQLGMKALDDYTLEITFKNPQGVDSFFGWYGYIYRALPKHLLEKVAPSKLATCDFWKHPVGNGCCTFDSEPVAGQELVLNARKDFYLGAPKFNKLTYLVVSGDNASNALLNGDVDTFYDLTDFDTLNSLIGKNGLHLEKFAGGADYVSMSINNVRFNANVRKALNLMIDKKALCSACAKGYGYPINDSVLHSDYQYKRDVQTAVSMLKAENFDFNKTITIACSSVRQNMAAIIKQCWLDGGVKSEVRVGETAKIFSDATSGAVDCCLMGNSESYNPTVEESILDPKASTFGQIQSSAYVDLCRQIDFETDSVKKAQLVTKYEQLLRNECPYIYLYATPVCQIESSRLKGTFGQFDQPWTWTITK